MTELEFIQQAEGAKKRLYLGWRLPETAREEFAFLKSRHRPPAEKAAGPG